ncbi:MAG: RNA-binding protein [Microcystis panniformis Mp_MB_F_20051200_S9]|uniref:RNA-binding protein n=1 Tax=Microcystis panniformis Mp_MB_F_20051200_S9 TaxID=2486223 RepID=A0A552Q8H1_9CHRO|nr:MAG: RNA-binding protein [Microcystis panniformis Mp_GB_SS_20050300_S99D]TRV48497.1 MAG: RNA-binding protein [Microcystis panniformis Mp_MB_F_20080800_S26D]TRV54843.1 MAG: RNA-binding protein [Microcystis panniformis Mp_GB_SS_20050300_S99]TRV60079.1 MAG: RNA-binding protein [Microcystis panniformis Mp_MB_F_20051200_S9D]TRV63583.1 MAG: RNA-binding protein [Microcystis panniformis Mp_MB_F_20080800_S26]TRV65525.1 MAG: RNA-binding protein [Microcystis panniformis Mp_MB_F_20051200_S9]TRV70789.1
MSIYVGNLPFEVDQGDVVEVFNEYGKIKRVNLPIDRETKRKRGFAFVEMETPEQESAAIAALDGAEWMGRELKVNQAREKEPRYSFGGGDRNRDRRY